jgi:aspartate ammonia-lyase
MYTNERRQIMRKEHDFMGELELPDTAYYGVQTRRAVHNFAITGHKIDQDLIIALAIIKKAAATANMKTGQLPQHIGKAIIQATAEIINGKWHEQFIVDSIQGGAGTSMNMNANEVIANLAIEKLGGKKGNYTIVSPNNHVNMAQSTNDVIPTAIRITVMHKSKRLIKELRDLANIFSEKAKEFNRVLKMGRTHLQDAVPITLGQEFNAYSCVIQRNSLRIKKSVENLRYINMGATAVGTGLNAEPEYVQEVVREISALTGETFHSSADLVDATQNTDCLADLSSALKVCALSLSKVANDLRLMASGPKCGFNEIILPALQPGSSIMPGKVNPVIPEVVNQVAFQVCGNDLTISLAVEAGQFELNVMEPVIACNLFQSIEILANAVHTLNYSCVCGIKANLERCQEMVTNSIGIITALSPHIGYEIACSVARESLVNDVPVKDLIITKGLVPQEHLEVILSPEEMTKPGISGRRFLSPIPQDAIS